MTVDDFIKMLQQHEPCREIVVIGKDGIIYNIDKDDPFMIEDDTLFIQLTEYDS